METQGFTEASFRNLELRVSMIAAKLRLNYVQGCLLFNLSCYFKSGYKGCLVEAMTYCQLGARSAPMNFSVKDDKSVRKFLKDLDLDSSFEEFVEDIMNQFWLGISTRILNLSES